MKTRTFVTSLFLGVALATGPAFAHGGMVETSIHDQEKLPAAPSSFKLTFQHDSLVSQVMLMSDDKKHIAVDFKPTKAMAKEYIIPLPQLGNGNYTLSWKSASKDGHAMSGAVRFTVTGS